MSDHSYPTRGTRAAGGGRQILGKLRASCEMAINRIDMAAKWQESFEKDFLNTVKAASLILPKSFWEMMEESDDGGSVLKIEVVRPPREPEPEAKVIDITPVRVSNDH